MTVFNKKTTKSGKKRKRNSRYKNDDASNIFGYLGPWGKTIKTKEEQEAHDKELLERKKEWDHEHPNHEEKMAAKPRRLDKEYLDKHNGEHGRSNSNSGNQSITCTTQMVDTQNKNAENEADLEELRRKREYWYSEQKKLESSEFHGDEFRDYQGRTRLNLNSNGLNKNKYYLPKQRIHTWIGHKSGVNRILFNKNGNLLFSCTSNDGSWKLWNVYDKRECLQTFCGHSKGVRNICLNNDSTKFLTASFDGGVKFWDIETGKIIWRGSSGKVPYVATLYLNNENEFLAGQKNKICVQWDMRANKIVQIYDEHLSAVNTITFIDNNRKFVTTSDDKTILVVWLCFLSRMLFVFFFCFVLFRLLSGKWAY